MDKLSKIEKIQDHIKRPFGFVIKAELIEQTRYLLYELKKEKRRVEKLKGKLRKGAML